VLLPRRALQRRLQAARARLGAVARGDAGHAAQVAVALFEQRPGTLFAADGLLRAVSGALLWLIYYHEQSVLPDSAAALLPQLRWCSSRSSRRCCCQRHRRLVAGADQRKPPRGAGRVEPPDQFADARDRTALADRRPAAASQEAADLANQAKSRYIAGISHEIRTPLNSILGYAQLLDNDPSIPEHRQQAIRVIRGSGEHLLSLIEGTLDIARIEGGKFTFDIVS
jgi:signal transduction histidine kinase